MLTIGYDNSKDSALSDLKPSPHGLSILCFCPLPGWIRSLRALNILFIPVGISFLPPFYLNWVGCPTLPPHIQPSTPHCPATSTLNYNHQPEEIRPWGAPHTTYSVMEKGWKWQHRPINSSHWNYSWKWIKFGELSAHWHGCSCYVSSLKLIIRNPFK